MKNSFKRYFVILLQSCMDIVTIAAIVITGVCLLTGYKERKSGEMEFIFGYKPIYIVSASMEDTILKHSIVLLEKISGEDACIGDIITFNVGNTLVTHRLIGKDEEAFNRGEKGYLITKGDSNRINDIDLLNPKNICGKVVKIYNFTGKIMNFVERLQKI